MDNLPPWTDPFCLSTMYEGWTAADDAIEEIWQIRMEITACFDHDIHKYGAYLMERQKRHGDRLVDPRTARGRIPGDGLKHGAGGVAVIRDELGRSVHVPRDSGSRAI
jgi:hypothetical protein